METNDDAGLAFDYEGIHAASDPALLPWWHPRNPGRIPEPYRSLDEFIQQEIQSYELLSGGGDGLCVSALAFPRLMKRLRVKVSHVMAATGLDVQTAVAQLSGYLPMPAATMIATRRLLELQAMTYGCLWQVCLTKQLDPRGVGLLSTRWLGVPFTGCLGEVTNTEWQGYLVEHKAMLDGTARDEAAVYLRLPGGKHRGPSDGHAITLAAWSPATEWTAEVRARSWWVGGCGEPILYVAADALLQHVDHWLIPLPQIAAASGLNDLQVFRQITGRSALTHKLHRTVQRLTELHLTELDAVWSPVCLNGSELDSLLSGIFARQDEYDATLGEMNDDDWETEIRYWVDTFGNVVDHHSLPTDLVTDKVTGSGDSLSEADTVPDCALPD